MRQGIVMEIQANKAIVFTNDCSLVKVAARSQWFVGQSVQLPEALSEAVHRRRWLVPSIAAACLILLACAALLLSGVLLPAAGPVYLSLDINPSVEFVLDANRVVTDVIPMNSDAWELLGDHQLTGLSYDEAIASWVSLAREQMPAMLDQLLISAVLSRRDRDFADMLMALDSAQNGGKIAALAGLNVKVLYTMDFAVKNDADANNLSFGRQMLLARSQELALGLDADEVRNAPLQTLIQNCYKPWPDETGGTTAETTPKATTETGTSKPAETSAATTATMAETAASTAATTAASTTVATTKATTKATTNATTKSTTDTNGERLLKVISNDADGWKLQWSQALANKEFYYYKVVFSKSDSTPIYPDNGYLYAISNRAEYQCRVNNSSCYNGGDFDGYLTPGQQYYVSITYVYADGKSTSNVLKLTYNGPAEPAPTTTASTVPTEAPVLNLAAVSDESGVHLSWDISPAEYSLRYYKVVISQSDGSPMYPGDGYLAALGRETTSWLADNSAGYNGGDFGGYLTPGTQYNFAITYVFADGDDSWYVSSNVIPLVYNGPPATE